MTAFNHAGFFAACRPLFGGKLSQAHVDGLNAALKIGFSGPSLVTDEPAWLVEGRKWDGLAEIPGPQHSPTILSWIKTLGGWFTDDETPWCGTFLAHCMATAGIKPLPVHWYRAKDWAPWGVECAAQVGAVGVKTRDGGGHVFIIVGETADKRYFKALGGNQSNRVCVTDIAKSDTFAIRWPGGIPQSKLALPKMPYGVVNGSET